MKDPNNNKSFNIQTSYFLLSKDKLNINIFTATFNHNLTISKSMLISIRIPVSPNCSKRISQNLKYKKICSPLLLFWFWLGADEVLQRALWIWKVASSKLKSWYNDFKKQQADPKWRSWLWSQHYVRSAQLDLDLRQWIYTRHWHLI